MNFSKLRHRIIFLRPTDMTTNAMGETVPRYKPFKPYLPLTLQTQATDVSPSLSDLQKEYLSDGKTTSEATGTGTTRSSVTRTLDRSSSASSYRNSDVVRAEIEMRVNSRFVAQIISDVKNYVAMQIY